VAAMGTRTPLRLPRAVLLAGLAFLGGCANPAATGSPAPTAAAVPPTAAASAATAMAPWPAPSDPMGLSRAAGLQPEAKEIFVNHVHAHLDVFVNGAPIVVPAGIGIAIEDPGVRRFDEPDGSVGYGGITQCGAPCISPLHTHGVDGILHTESGTLEPNHLGQFFIEWGVALTATCVGDYCSPETPIAFYVNGEAFTGDPTTIELADRAEIAIVIGTPPAVIPATADFSKA
jgi:hypothetical protein